MYALVGRAVAAALPAASAGKEVQLYCRSRVRVLGNGVRLGAFSACCLSFTDE